MADTTIWEELSKMKNPQRRVYFQWRNGVNNINLNYGEMTEEEIKKRLGKKDLSYLERWESSADYKRLLFLLKEDNFATDLLDVYEATKKKAIEGDSQAIKNMLLLQKEIKQYRQSIDKFQELEEKEEEDDGLRI